MTSKPTSSTAAVESGARSRERQQLAGIDPHARGFNRPVEFERHEGEIRAVLRYETTRVTVAEATHAAALSALIRCLHEQGYRQLRTQLSFREGEYLGNREPWIEYPDPRPVQVRWWERLARWFSDRRRPGLHERQP